MAEERKVPIALDDSLSDEEKKKLALQQCAVEHLALLNCFKGGYFADCNRPRKEFWDCYGHHRGVSELKITRWINRLKPKTRMPVPETANEFVKEEKSGDAEAEDEFESTSN